MSDKQVKRLRKVESKADLHEIKTLALDLPLVAAMLDAEHTTIRNYYSDLWEAVHETVERRQALCCQVSPVLPGGLPRPLSLTKPCVAR